MSEAYQLSPVKEWTASMTYCRAATGGNESAAAAATSPGNDAGKAGTTDVAASERTPAATSIWPAAGSERTPAAASISAPEEEVEEEKLRWAKKWAPKGRGRARLWDLERRRRSPEGRCGVCWAGSGGAEEEEGSSRRSWWEGRRWEREGWRRRVRW
jgi:hypothetical protein